MMGGWVVMEETAPQILTNATKPMKAYWVQRLQNRIHMQNQELERQCD